MIIDLPSLPNRWDPFAFPHIMHPFLITTYGSHV